MKAAQGFLVVVVLAIGAAMPVCAAPSITEFPLPTVNPGPYGITTGPDGNLWFTEARASKIAKMTPAGVITEYFVTSGLPLGITKGPDGNLWFTQIHQGRIGRMTTDGNVNYYYTPTRNSWPAVITMGPDGNLWFTEVYVNKIGRITPAGIITEYPVPAVNAWDLSGITAGPDGNLWFTLVDSYKVGKITPAGAITLYTTPTANAQPSGITSGPDGNLWFIEDIGRIGRITTAGIITEYPVPGAGDEDLSGITGGPDGNVWFTFAHANKIGRVTPAGAVTQYTVPTSNSGPVSITTGPDGNLWFTELDGGKIGKITPAGLIAEFPVPPSSALPGGITTGPDGNLWFTEEAGNRIGRITPAGVVTEYPVPTDYAMLGDITAGPDGNLWFTESFGNKIGRITPSGVITEFPVPTENASPGGIVKGPDGNLWFTEVHADKIGRITPAGIITEYSLAPYSSPTGITLGADGNLWFTSDSGVDKIGRITPAGVVTQFPLPTADGAPNFGITLGPDGNVWFTEDDGNRIGKITPTGVITEYPLSMAAALQDIVAGLDGNLWFTEALGNKIGKITPAGAITEYDLPTTNAISLYGMLTTGPVGITKGPDGNLWFTEAFANKIGRLNPSGPAPLLSVALTGPGTVTSSPTGIACGADCTESFSLGTVVNLTATPASTALGGTFSFVGWRGSCGKFGTQAACNLVTSVTDIAGTAFTYVGAGSDYSRNYVQKAYVAYYGRPAEPEGLGYWADRMDREGRSLNTIIGAFGYSDEFNRRYGGLGARELVTRIYQQVLGREPDPAGLDWYVAELQAGRRTLQTITLDVLNGATTPPDSTVVANKLDVATYFTAKVASSCGYSGESTGVASLTPVSADTATAATSKAAVDTRCGNEFAVADQMLVDLSWYLPQALAENQTFLQRNPDTAALTQAKIDMLKSPALATDIRNGKYHSSTTVASIDGRSIPVAVVFPQPGLRIEASQFVDSVAAAVATLEDFLRIPYPTVVKRVWLGFDMSALGGGQIRMTDRLTWEAMTAPSDQQFMPYEAILDHEVSHAYIGNESLNQFLELYVYNMAHTKSASVPSWIHTRDYIPWRGENAGAHALLDIYQLIGKDAMAAAYRTIHPLNPLYGVPLSAACRQAFVDQAPAALKAQVSAIVGRI